MTTTGHFTWYPPGLAFMERKVKMRGSCVLSEAAPPPSIAFCEKAWAPYQQLAVPCGTARSPFLGGGGAKNLISMNGRVILESPAIDFLVGTSRPHSAH